MLWALTLLVYSNSFRSELIYDNVSRIVEDTRVHAATAANVDLIFRYEYWYPSLASGLYRPLTTLSFLFNYAVLGNQTRPAGYHVLNWLLHAVNATLLYWLALLLIGEMLPAAAIAAVWAVHPVLTESVTNIVGRADMMAATGILGGLICYIYAVRTRAPMRWLWLAGAAAAVAIGTFSKESTLVVLPIVALYEWLFGTSKERSARIAGYAALTFPLAIFWAMRARVFSDFLPIHVPFTDNPIGGAGFFQGKFTAIKVLGKEMALLAWPARLSADYSYNEIPLASWGDMKAWLALAACLGIAAAGIWCFKRNRAVAFAIGVFFLSIAPTSNLGLVIGTEMAERLLYVPAMGFVAAAIALAAWVLRRVPVKWQRAALVFAIASLGARTFARNFDWKDQISLWRSAVAASPDSYKTHQSYSKFGPGDMTPELEKALTIVEGLPDELNTVEPFVLAGDRYRAKGDAVRGTAPTPPEESMRWYRKSLEILLHGQRIQDAHNAEILRKREELLSARFNPPWSPIYQALGRTYIRLSEFGKAAEAMRKNLALRQSAEGFEELSVAYYQGGDHDQAAIALFEGIATNPNDTKLATELVSLYGQIDPKGCAVEAVNGGSSLNMNCAAVHQHACSAWRNVAVRNIDQARPQQARMMASYAVNALGCAPESFPAVR